MSQLDAIRAYLRAAGISCPVQQKMFFKTGAGEYAEHDQFIGASVPSIRKCVRQFREASLHDMTELIASPINEERLCAILMAVEKYQEYQHKRDSIYHFYMQNIRHINNWNLVDASAHHIVGAHMWGQKNLRALEDLAQRPNLWERRIAMVATWHTIRQGEWNWTTHVATLLLHDTHDLIHKAVGWMLREMGKRNEEELMNFLQQHAADMPRTMLRYAMEKIPPGQRTFIMTTFCGQ